MAISKRVRHGVVFFVSTGAIGFFVLVVWHAAVTQKTPENLPVITAPASPARVTPEFPGGMQHPNENLSIYDTFDESNSETVDDLDPGSGDRSISEVRETPRASGDTTRVDDGDLMENVTALEPVVESKEAALDVEKNLFVAQLGAFGTSEAAEEGWKFLTSKHGSIMADLDPAITAVDLGEVGILYRLQTGPLGGRVQVEEFCRVLRESDADCLVVRP